MAQASRQRELSKRRNVQQFGDSYRLIALRWASADTPKCEGALCRAPATRGVGAPFPAWDGPQPLPSVPGKSLPPSEGLHNNTKVRGESFITQDNNPMNVLDFKKEKGSR